MERARETRWIVLAADGRHVTLARHSEPSAEDIERARAGLEAAGLSGWLAVLKGPYYRRARPALSMVRALAGEPAGWNDAAAAFKALRQEAIRAY